MKLTEKIGPATIKIEGNTVTLDDPSILKTPEVRTYDTEEDAINAYDDTCQFAARFHHTPRPDPDPATLPLPDFRKAIRG